MIKDRAEILKRMLKAEIRRDLFRNQSVNEVKRHIGNRAVELDVDPAILKDLLIELFTQVFNEFISELKSGKVEVQTS